MRVALTTLVALALVAAACGGGETASAPSAATQSGAALAPADAAGYVGVDTDLESGQWHQLQELLDRFPDGDRVLEWFADELGDEGVSWEEDVQPALGPVSAVVVLGDDNDTVVLVQPDDRTKLEALLAKANEEQVTADLEDGWVAVAEEQGHLDAYRTAVDRGTLDGAAGFREAMTGLPEDSIAVAYLSGKALASGWTAYAPLVPMPRRVGPNTDGTLESLGLAVEATDDGLRIAGSVRTDGPEVPSYEPTLFRRVPDRSIIAVSFHGTPELTELLGSEDALGAFLPAIEEQLGVELADILELLEGEAALYVRPGLVIPEVSLAVEAPDAARAMGIVDRLARGLGGEVETLEVDGVTAHAVAIDKVRIVWAAFDGVLLVSTAPTAIRDFRSDGAKLVEDERFQEAVERVGLGDRTGGLVYADLDEAVPFLEGLAGLAGERLPAEWRRNLEPLDTFVAEGGPDGEAVRFEAFLAVAGS
jgi:hypothetical protein